MTFALLCLYSYRGRVPTVHINTSQGNENKIKKIFSLEFRLLYLDLKLVSGCPQFQFYFYIYVWRFKLQNKPFFLNMKPRMCIWPTRSHTGLLFLYQPPKYFFSFTIYTRTIFQIAIIIPKPLDRLRSTTRFNQGLNIVQ